MANFDDTTQYRGYILRLVVEQESQDIANNQTKCNWWLYIINQGSRFTGTFSYYVSIDGVERANFTENVNTTDVGFYEAHLLNSGTYTATHNNDGTKSIYCYASCSGGGSNGPGSGAAAGWLTLTTIPRAAAINSFSGNDIDTDFSVGYTKYVNEWNYYLKLMLPDYTVLSWQLYNTSGEIFRLPDNAKDLIYNYVGNNDSVNISVVLETWNGNTKIGDSTVLTNTCTINRNVWIKVNGVWKRGKPYVKINGVWKAGIPYIKINGVWKKAI